MFRETLVKLDERFRHGKYSVDVLHWTYSTYKGETSGSAAQQDAFQFFCINLAKFE